MIGAVAAAVITCSSSLAEEPEVESESMMTGIEIQPAEADSDTAHYDQLTSQILDYASTLVGKPYSWGATGPRAYDCSGFTRHVFNNFGLELNRSSRDQYLQGEAIELADVRPGDLLFFGGRRNSRSVGHVGIATEVGADGSIHFIHSATSQGVRYDNLQESQYFKTRYIGARRIL